jgi:hypothetical protein
VALVDKPAFALNAAEGSGVAVEVTGHGNDTGDPDRFAFLQQTARAVGTRVGDRIEHFVDTEGGSSGSPIILDDKAWGIHTAGTLGICTPPAPGPPPVPGTNPNLGVHVSHTHAPGVAGRPLAPAITNVCQTALLPFRFSGSGSGSGRGPGRGALKILGRFAFAGGLDLSGFPATVTLTSLLNQGGAAGDVVQGLPLTLVADSRNTATTAAFETRPGILPIATMTIRAKGRGVFDFRLEVSQATIDVPGQCPPAANLRTTFMLDDGVNQLATVATVQPWRCFGTGNRYLRTP